MLDIPEIIKQRCRDDNNRTETVKHLQLAFLQAGLTPCIRLMTSIRQRIYILLMQENPG